MDTDQDQNPRDELTSEVAGLRNELERLNGHRFIRIQNSVPRMLGFQFVRGLALGLGTVVGASVLVSVLVYFLSTIDFLPIIGDWATQIVKDIEESRAPSNAGRPAGGN